MRDYFGHYCPMYAAEVAELLEIRGVGISATEVERSFARAGKRIIRRQLNEENPKLACIIAEKGVAYLQAKYGSSGIRTLVIDGTKPWQDRHCKLPMIARRLSGRICIVDKYYGRGTLALLNHFRHGSPLHFLTGRTSEDRNAFARELYDFRKEVPALEVRVFPRQNELHDRYVISDRAVVVVGTALRISARKSHF